ncbi:MAG: long-chain fatty acid--CoA ligase [SAR324 cluster bacterium]|nr:long-chain fatty acid--CoA ligase [SAR324 cluster bacterium]MBL7036110.1 long-chain fatty acid--CoA ligase [SAR324 cluster bacterium]
MTTATVKSTKNNLVEMLDNSRKLYADRPLYGTKRDGNYEWTSYEEFAEKVDAFRAGLASLGVSAGDKVAIICKNTEEWAVSAYATYGLCAQHIPMYETQLPKEWEFIIRDCGAKVLLAANTTVLEQTSDFVERIDELEHIVLLSGTSTGAVKTYSDLLKSGRENPVEAQQPEAQSPMGMIYTSGTTGDPKGVVLSHRNLIFECEVVLPLFGMTKDDRTLAFLPWAHVFGQVAEVHGLINSGGSAGLVDDVNTLIEELGVVKPSMFFAVPRVYNRIYERLRGQMQEKPGFIRSLFYGGLKQAKREREGETLSFLENLTLTLARKIIFKKVYNRFGGNLRIAVSGASALSPAVAEFVNDIGISVFEGYGLSENTAALSVNYPGARRFGSVGKPLPGVRIEIDKSVEGSKEEDGEVLAYGENIMLGYHNLPEITKESITKEGGLRTGDLGHLDADGYLYITGRVKEQYKLENGKYVAPAPLEETLKLSAYIDQIMLYGFNRAHNVAVIVAAMPAVEKYAEENEITASGESLLTDPKIRQLFQEQLDRYGKDFKSFERPQNFTLLAEEWGIDNGLLTPTLKLKREVVEKQFMKQIESLYS